MKLFASILTACVFSTPLLAQLPETRIDSTLQALYKQHEIAGNVLIAEKGKTVYTRSLGYADRARGIVPDAQTSFQLASLSKTFTAIAILQLKEKGKLQLDEPAKKYLPAFKYEGITIRQLLSHTSGLNDLQMFEAPYMADTSRVFTIADLVPVINTAENSIVFAPGEKWKYSNSGFGLLALIVEKVSGMPFQNYLAKNIFRPAGMMHSYVNTPLIAVNDAHRAKVYDYLNYAPWVWQKADSLPQNRVEYHNLMGLMGHSNIISTTGDLLLYDRALYGHKLLKQATLQEAFQPARLNNGQLAQTGWANNECYYGLGWCILKDSSQGKVVFHAGGMAGAVTIMLRNITKDQTVIMLNNVTHRGTHEVGVNLLRLLNGREPAQSKKSLSTMFARTLITKNPDAALAQFNTHKTDTAHYYLNEREMNILGLQMFYNGYAVEGMEVLRLNTLLFPGSANVYDSYAGALKSSGKVEEARMTCLKTLALAPGHAGAKKMLMELDQ